jgi:hypothetical protein
MLRLDRHRLRQALPFLGALAFILFACSLAGNEAPTQTFSFNKSFDTLAQFDSVIITLKDTTGKTIDILYRGKADTIREIENLPAKHWKGEGIAVLSIVGYDSGSVVYHVDKRFDGKNDQILDSINIILPGTHLTPDDLEIVLTEGDSVPLPKITVTPIELSDKSIAFVSSSPTQLMVGAGYLRALGRGIVKLTADLVSNPSHQLTFRVTIQPNPLTPDSLEIVPDTLFLAANGAPGSVTAKAFPATADPNVIWTILDSSIAYIPSPGTVQGLKAGTTQARAISTRKPAVSRTSLIVVSAPVPVQRVRFWKDSLDLFVGGAVESLLVEVLPAQASHKVEFSILNPSIVGLGDGRIQGLAPGTTQAIVRSIENPALSDTLAITVFPTQKIDSVRVSPDSLVMYTGGPSGTLSAKVYPQTANQSILWRVRSSSVVSIEASGKLTALSPGRTRVVGLSRVDSTKRDSAILAIKRDVPNVGVGRDTVLAVGTSLSIRPSVIQEFGSVAQFRWDLNGDGTFEGQSDTLRTLSVTFNEAKETVLAFGVKDSEGNDTVVYKKVKAVIGPAVQILAPLDSTYTNQFAIPVSWTINGKIQDSLKTEVLKLGANKLTRSARDEAGNLYSASITIIVDTTPPNKPLLHGPQVTGSKNPTWTWSTGGGGAGIFKYWLDVDDSSKGKEIRDTAFTPATELTEGMHTLFVAERDKAGNWSLAGRLTLKLDVSAPGAPKVTTSPQSPTNVRRPKWVWSSGGGGLGSYQYKLDNNNLGSGTTSTSDTAFTPASNLTVGTHTLYVQEKDSAGNWSATGSASLVIDTIPPGVPTVMAVQSSPTNEAKPTWKWTSGGNGGKGFYRYKLGDTLWASGAQTGSATVFTPASGLTEGVKILFVEEQDSAGNWSAAGNFPLAIDLTPPSAPKMDSTPYSPLNSLNPTWTWMPGGGGNGNYRIRLDNPDMTGGTMRSVANYTPGGNLQEGKHTLYAQESDSAGNWSAVAKREIIVAVREPAGGKDIISVGYWDVNSALSKTGDLYISTVDVNDSTKSVVMKYTGTGWSKLGSSGLGLGAFGPLPVATSSSGAPYVVFNASGSYKASVAKWNGASWQLVGSAAFSEGMMTYPAIAIGPGDVPYVAFKDDANASKVSVMRYFGGTWEYVGGKPGISVGSTDEIGITIGDNGKAYLVHLDQSGPTVYSVLSFSGTEWVKLGDLNSYGSLPSIAVNSAGVLHVCFHSTDGKAALVKWSGSAFVNVGTNGFSDAAVNGVSLRFGHGDVPYVAFEDKYPDTGTGSAKPTVMRYRNNAWEAVGPKRFLDGNVWSTHLFLDDNDVPAIIFNSQSLGGTANLMRATFDP